MSDLWKEGHMSHLKITLAFISFGSLMMAQSPDKAKQPVGNEKTVGIAKDNGQFQRADDRNVVGNAKTVGGPTAETFNAYRSEDPKAPAESGVGSVGNAKTVGGR